jgi:hypothetical protein
MKSIFISFFLLVIFTIPSISQSLDRDLFVKYELQRKDKATALVLWNIPGASLFYTGNDFKGMLFIVGDVSSYIILKNSLSMDGESNLIPVFLFVSVRIWELVEAFQSVDTYNNELFKKLSISITQQNNIPAVTLSLSL